MVYSLPKSATIVRSPQSWAFQSEQPTHFLSFGLATHPGFCILKRQKAFCGGRCPTLWLRGAGIATHPSLSCLIFHRPNFGLFFVTTH